MTCDELRTQKTQWVNRLAVEQSTLHVRDQAVANRAVALDGVDLGHVPDPLNAITVAARIAQLYIQLSIEFTLGVVSNVQAKITAYREMLDALKAQYDQQQVVQSTQDQLRATNDALDAGGCNSP